MPNAQEDAESRLERLKRETTVIQQHNKKLENKETVSNKLAAEAVADSEVSSNVNLT